MPRSRPSASSPSSRSASLCGSTTSRLLLEWALLGLAKQACASPTSARGSPTTTTRSSGTVRFASTTPRRRPDAAGCRCGRATRRRPSASPAPANSRGVRRSPASSPTACGRTTPRCSRSRASQNTTHAEVTCVQCHVGDGARELVHYKLAGVRQPVHVINGNYPRPIPASQAVMRPALEPAPPATRLRSGMVNARAPFASTPKMRRTPRRRRR